MIDPLLNIAIPLPGASPASQDAVPGTPSFLPWMQPGQDDAGTNAGKPDPLSTPVQNHLPDLVAVDPFVPDPRVAQASQADPSIQLQPASTQVASLALLANDSRPVAGQPELLSDSTRLVLDATRWRDYVTAMLELHVRNPQGEREVVAMPWRLMASGHLAHANAMSGMPGQASVVDGARPGAETLAATAVALPGLPFVSPASMSPVFAGKGAPIAAVLSQASGSTRDDVATLQAMSSNAPAAAEWLARWMKWIERDGRDAVVWLRDFSIDEDQAARVVDELRSFAQAQGVGLERIVVNGRELWRNPQLVDFSGHRE